jgi:hypothetical protein
MKTECAPAPAADWTPFATAAKKGLDMSGTISPMLPVRPVIRPRAARLGW